MGIDLNLATLLRDVTLRHELGGLVATFGEQTLTFDPSQVAALSAAKAIESGMSPAARLFARLGFAGMESIDVDGSEGATHLLDLNCNDTPTHLIGRFDLVLNGGTLEHVFHVPNALAHASRMLRPGGAVIHVLPCHNWVEHGFYQFSPTLMFDYYRMAGFNCLESMLVGFAPDSRGSWLIRCAWPGQLGHGLVGALDAQAYLHLFVARRGEAVVLDPRPQQTLYAAPSAGDRRDRPRWFPPFVLQDGVSCDIPPRAAFDLPADQMRPEQGEAWMVPLADLTETADNSGFPARSSLVLLEDGVPLGPAHAPHAAIRASGCGRYSHWGDSLYFAASDNTAPARNGRRYSILLPGLAAAESAGKHRIA